MHSTSISLLLAIASTFNGAVGAASTEDHATKATTHGMDVTTLLGECKGDCDTDKDCKGALACFHRNGLEPITGCTGLGQTSWDYCCKSHFRNCPGEVGGGGRHDR